MQNGHILQAPTPVGHTRLTEAVAQHVAQALRKAALGEPVVWETAFMLAPTPQGPQPLLAIYLQIPSPLIGQFCRDVMLLEAHLATEVAIAEAVTEGMNRLYTARAQAGAMPIATI